jgi:hypothetical protein
MAVDRDGFGELVGAAMAASEVVSTIGPVSVHVWQDASGARLIMWTERDSIVDLLPSFAGTPGAVLSEVRRVNDEVAIANVLDGDGEMVTMLAAALEQNRILAATKASADGPAIVVALGSDVTVHEDEEAFAASDASLLGDAAAGEPPAHVVEQNMPWPPRMAAESFISYGVFGPPEQAEAYARLHGTVLEAQRRTNALTGQSFIAARVRTAGFEVDLCLPGNAQVPQPGNVVGGTVFLVASLPDLVAPASSDAPAAGKRTWLPWRR